MARLVLVDTVDALPGLLPLHAWSALMSSDLVLVGDQGHPFVPHLELAELRVEVLPQPSEGAALSRADLLSGLAPADKKRAEHVVDRARSWGEGGLSEAEAAGGRGSGQGQVAYLFGRADAEAFTRVLGLEAARGGVEVEVVYFGVAPRGVNLLELVEVQRRLRAPDGCPWDAEQTHQTLARYAVEEVYELLDAIAAGDVDAMREELGDVLLQVVFQAQVAEDHDEFTIDDVARDLVDKLVRRHPHVFGDASVADAAGVVANWDELKRAEKPERTGVFDGVPAAQPALQYVEQLQSRAARRGFDWDADREAADRVRLELDEFLSAPDDDARAKEVGDLLMSVVGLARRHAVDPELALREAALRFRARVERMADLADRPLEELDRDAWLALWDRAKTEVS